MRPKRAARTNPIARPEPGVVDLPLEDPKLVPEDQEFSLAIV